MILLLLVILSNLCLGIVFKLFKKYNIGNLQAIIFNYIVCFLLGSILQGKAAVPDQFWNVSWFPYSIGLGLLFILGFYITAITVQKFGMAFTSVMQKMSLILPAIFAIVMYQESANTIKIIGIIIAIISIWLVNYPIKSFKRQIEDHKMILLFPAIVFLSSGLIEIMLFYLDRNKIVLNGDINFVSFIFGIAGIIGFLSWIIIGFKAGWKIERKNIIAGLILGVPNFFSIYLLVVLINKGWQGSVLFPINNVGILVLSTLTGFIVFHEHMNKWRWTGLLLALASIYLISY